MILIPSVRRSARGRDKESMANRKFHKKQRFTPDPSYVPPYDAAILQLGLDHLKISDAVREKLLGAGVTTVMDVVVREDKDFYRISGFDRKNLGELKSALNNRRLRLKPPKPADEKPKAESEKNGSGERADKPAAKNDRAEKKEGDRRRDKFVKSERTGERENAPERRDRFGADKGKEVSDDRSKNRDRKDNRSDKKNKNQRILNPDGVSEKRTKEEREKHRPRRPKVEHPSDIYIKINKNNKWGFATRDGKEVITPEYDDVFTFKEDLCCVEKDETFGFIDRSGNLVVPIAYECASSFSEGYACVFKGGVCGYIDKTGETVIPFKYDAGTAVIDGECRVKKAGKWGELHISDPENVRWIN